jgi:predicted aldo/keto reductase-like oxidoreductase
MNYTGFSFNNKKLAAMSVGCMRFLTRDAAVDVIQKCAENDVVYLDTSPMYCYKSEEDNTETWSGTAIKGNREKYIVSAKCSPGNGGNEIGEYDKARGFSVNSADKVRGQIEQSLKRLDVDYFDCYQLWAAHVPLIFDEALKTDGWMEGVLKAKEEGIFKHLGITGHADSMEIKRWVDSGFFEMITVPYNIIDNSREEGIRYALDKGLAVIAMNPLVGGLMGSASKPLAEHMADMNIESAIDLALRYVVSIPGVSALCGMTSGSQVDIDVKSISKPLWSSDEQQAIHKRFNSFMGNAENVCTGCKYCMPCPQDINIPGILDLRNFYNVLKIESAANEYRNRYSGWGDSWKADRCISCGVCESKCPNSLPISELMKEITVTFK